MADILSIDGVSLRSEVMGCSTRTGRHNIPAKRGENTVVPGRSGSLFLPNKPFEEGMGTLSVWVIGATTSNGLLVRPINFTQSRLYFEQNMVKMERFFTQPHRLSVITTTQPDNSYRTASVEWKEWTEPEIMAGGTRAEWAISYVIPGVWWSDTTPFTQTRSNAGPLELTSFKGMTGILEDAVISVTGPATAPKVVDLETGYFVQYTGNLTAGQVWTVDVGLATSKIGGANALANTIHSGTYRLLSISNVRGATDTPVIELIATGTTTSTQLSITAKRKWISG